MTDWKDFALNLGALSLVGFVVAFGVRGGWKIAQEVMGAENVKEGCKICQVCLRLHCYFTSFSTIDFYFSN